jgi:hypothetical protein
LKQTGPLRKVKLHGLPEVDWLFLISCAAFNLLRIPKLRSSTLEAQFQPYFGCLKLSTATTPTTNSTPVAPMATAKPRIIQGQHTLFNKFLTIDF